MSDETEKIRIFLVEYHPVMRMGLKMILQERGYHICGEAASSDEALRALLAAGADVAIFALSLNGKKIFDVLKQVRYSQSSLGIIVYSMHNSQLFVENAMKIGVNAYVSKADPVEALVDAISAVRAGRVFLGPTLTKSLAGSLDGSALVDVVQELSERELEVLTLIGSGFGRAEIAASLSLSARTIDTFIERIKSKLKVTSNRELLREAIRIAHAD